MEESAWYDYLDKNLNINNNNYNLVWYYYKKCRIFSQGYSRCYCLN